MIVSPQLLGWPVFDEPQLWMPHVLKHAPVLIDVRTFTLRIVSRRSEKPSRFLAVLGVAEDSAFLMVIRLSPDRSKQLSTSR